MNKLSTNELLKLLSHANSELTKVYAKSANPLLSQLSNQEGSCKKNMENQIKVEVTE